MLKELTCAGKEEDQCTFIRGLIEENFNYFYGEKRDKWIEFCGEESVENFKKSFSQLFQKQDSRIELSKLINDIEVSIKSCEPSKKTNGKPSDSSNSAMKGQENINPLVVFPENSLSIGKIVGKTCGNDCCGVPCEIFII